MTIVNAIGATWTILMFVLMGAICIKYGDEPNEMPSFSTLGFKRKVAAYLVSVFCAGCLPWLVAALLFKTFVFGW
ncbi:hypothetical protein [Pantoea sp. ME81]|uniref:hypothetical protein n=1 Tax=Pantoea sp. ME81 TaxID=2743935 RepID=UPI0015F465A5|nr:hypothetical protein [Pantoea sp. ME81]